MSELPEGWISTTLGQVVNYADNETVDPTDMPPEAWLLELEDIQRDTGKVLEWKTVGERLPKSAKNRFRAGDVLYGKLRPYLNKVVKAEKNGFCSNEIIAISPGLLDQSYLFFSIRSPNFIDYVSNVSHGMRMPRLGTQQAKGAPFRLPPLTEQARIAAKLDELLALVDTLKSRIDGIPSLLKRFRLSVLAAATSGRLTGEWRATNPVGESAEEYLEKVIQARRQSPIVKFKEPISPDLERYDFEAPSGWMIASVSNFAECLDSMRVPVKKELRKSGEGRYPYFGANGEVDRVDEYIFDDDLVLVTEDETFYGREKPIAYKYSWKCWINNHVHALRAHDSIARDYLCYALMHYDVIPWLTGTTGRAKLTQGALLSLPIQVPPPLEQTEIVRRVEQLFAFADQLETRVKVAQARINRLTQSILAKAFRGELVPQEPTDEPASVLLERIKAQRTTAPKAKRGRRAATLD